MPKPTVTEGQVKQEVLKALSALRECDMHYRWYMKNRRASLALFKEAIGKAIAFVEKRAG